MDAKTIDILSTLDPSSKLPRISTASARQNHDSLFEESKERYLSKYVRTGFGWYIAHQFASKKEGFPIPMQGRDMWVYKAFLYLVDPVRHQNRNIEEAFHMANTIIGAPNIGASLKAMVMSVKHDDPVKHLEALARITGIPYKTIEAFESLFYNILDRREDGIYIASEVYPETRLIELTDGYMDNAAFGDLLKRSGYNQRNLDLTSYLIGIGDHEFMSKLAAQADGETQLSAAIMSNGLLLAMANLLNHRSIGLSRASSLMVASRQSGTLTDDPSLSGIAPLFADEFSQAMRDSQRDTARRMKLDAGSIIEV